MFRIVSTPIEPADTRIDNPAAGGFVTFEGRVRDHSEGHNVMLLEYEAYSELAVAEGNQILDEARERFDVLDATAVHRTGQLAIGDVAVRVEVAAAHRQAAFSACQYIIDELKSRVPIWKKETFESGDSGWVNHP